MATNTPTPAAPPAGHRLHTLIVTAEPCPECAPDELCELCAEQGPELEYSIACPGTTSACTRWTECVDCTSRSREDTTGSVFDELAEHGAHGVEHMHIAGFWATPTELCNVQVHDQLPDAAGELDLAPGEYPVDFDTNDGTDLILIHAA
jgi:hypothetical protein